MNMSSQQPTTNCMRWSHHQIIHDRCSKLWVPHGKTSTPQVTTLPLPKFHSPTIPSNFPPLSIDRTKSGINNGGNPTAMSPDVSGTNGAISENEGGKVSVEGKNYQKTQDFGPDHPSSLVSLRWLDFSSEDEEEEWRWLKRCVEAAGKGFLIGTGLKGGLALFAFLARLRSRRSRKMGLLSNGEAAVIATKETLRYGLFLGTYAGIFVSVDECIAAAGGRKRTANWRALIAGLIAGPSILLTGPGTQNTSLAVYILMRAAVLASRCGIKSKRFGHVCKPMTWSYGDIFLMCLSSSQILSSYILKQESLPSTYKSFLNMHGGKDSVILEGMKSIATGMPFTNLREIESYYQSTGVHINLDPKMKVPCSIVHADQSCTGHFMSFLLQAYQRAIPVYLPVYLFPALIVHRQDLLKGPYTILWKSVLGTARSSLFLSMYCTSAWMWTCILFRIFKRCTIPMVVVGTFPTGLALAIEKKSRRMEISLYCLARALESFFTCMNDAGLCPQTVKLRRANVAVFSLSTAVIMHCYAQERDVFRSKYLNVLDWVFGVPTKSDKDK